MWQWREGARRVARLRRALWLLAGAALLAAGLLYWRQQLEPLRPRAAPHVAPRHAYHCRDGRCERLPPGAAPPQSLHTCAMLCAHPPLWPQPTGPVALGERVLPVRAAGFSLHVQAAPPSVAAHLNDAFQLLRGDLRAMERRLLDPPVLDLGAPLDVLVRVAVNGSDDVRLRLDTDESYTLVMITVFGLLVVDVHASSFCGARHAFETLSQLVWPEPDAATLVTLDTASVTDAPRFHYRGLLLDTARNFFPVEDILRTIDAMAANKLNTFHWHASDSQAFPLRLQRAPQLAAHGAYSARATYSRADVRTVVRHARLRGVRVLLEVDVPAHVGRAWSWGEAAGLGALAHCVEVQPWSAYCGEPPCGQLNPLNPHVYRILEDVYAEILELTGTDDVFHLGGDEVSERCWMQHFNESDPMELWLEFTTRSLAALERANGGKVPELPLLWSSRLTRAPYLERLDARLGVQVWGASQWPESRELLDAGVRAVLSHVDAWYLDCGFGSWRDSSDGHCGPYRSWQQVYEHRPWADAETSWRVTGGAACQWSEQLGAGGLDARVWPRAAALAERLWSDPAVAAAAPVYARLDVQRARMLARGVRAAPLWPQWCSLNPGACL